MTTTPNVADDLAHAHLQMASGAFLKVFDLLRGSKAPIADSASVDQAVIVTDDLAWVVAVHGEKMNHCSKPAMDIDGRGCSPSEHTTVKDVF
jgi:hypothetical protein